MAELDVIAEELATTLAAAHGAFCAEHPVCGDEEGRLALHLVAAPVKGWLLRRALDQNDGRCTTTARQLGLTREGLYK